MHFRVSNNDCISLLYNSARSSTDSSTRDSRSPRSLDAAKSSSKLASEKLRHNPAIMTVVSYKHIKFQVYFFVVTDYTVTVPRGQLPRLAPLATPVRRPRHLVQCRLWDTGHVHIIASAYNSRCITLTYRGAEEFRQPLPGKFFVFLTRIFRRIP